MFEGTRLIVYVLPASWPPPFTSEIFRHTEEDGTVIVTVDASGRLMLMTASASHGTRACHFQPIEAQPRTRILLLVTWRGDDLRIYVNSKRPLEPDPTRTMSPILIAGDPAHVPPPPTLLFPDLDAGLGVDEAEVLLLGTIRDIDAKLLEGATYALIRASGLLRQLLLDGHPLVERVNRKYRCKLKFVVLEPGEAPVQPDEEWRSVDPFILPGVATLALTRQQFLATQVLRVGSDSVSVADVIKACANAKGGVHFGEPDGREQELLLGWEKTNQFNRLEPSLVLLAGICRVTLIALFPLVSAIKSRSCA